MVVRYRGEYAKRHIRYASGKFYLIKKIGVIKYIFPYAFHAARNGYACKCGTSVECIQIYAFHGVRDGYVCKFFAKLKCTIAYLQYRISVQHGGNVYVISGVTSGVLNVVPKSTSGYFYPDNLFSKSICLFVYFIYVCILISGAFKRRNVRSRRGYKR